MTKDEALKIALETLEYWDVHGKLHQPTEEAIAAIKKALAQPEQEPVAWRWIPSEVWNEYVLSQSSEQAKLADEHGLNPESLYTTPPQRKPLPPQSPCEMTQAEGKMFKLGWLECEAAHGIKENT